MLQQHGGINQHRHWRQAESCCVRALQFCALDIGDRVWLGDRLPDRSDWKDQWLDCGRKTAAVQRPRRWKSRRIHQVNPSLVCLQCRQAQLPTQSRGRAVSKTSGSSDQYLPPKEQVFTASRWLQFSFSLCKFLFRLSFFSFDLLKPSRLHKEIRATQGSGLHRKKPFEKNGVFGGYQLRRGLSDTIIILGSCGEEVQKAPQTRHSVWKGGIAVPPLTVSPFCQL